MPIRTHAFVLLLLSLLVAGPARSQPQYEATVMPESHQVIRGWGIFAGATRAGHTFNIVENEWARHALYRDLGITLARVEVYPEYYAGPGELDTRHLDTTLVQQVRQLVDHGVPKYISSVWSPPAEFKICPTTKGRCEDGSENRLREDAEDDYVAYITQVFEYIRDQQLPVPYAHSIQNELSYAASWDATVYTPEQWRRVIRKTRDSFDRNGLEQVGLIGPESGSYRGTLNHMGGPGFPLLDTDPQLRRDLAGAATHGYDDEGSAPEFSPAMRMSMLNALAHNKETWMTEWSLPEGETPLELAINASRRLGREIVYIPMQNWVWWLGWRSKFSREELIINREKQPLYYIFQRLWHHAPPGSIVRHLRTTDPDLVAYGPAAVDMVGFETTSGTTVLLINPTEEARRLRVDGLTGAQGSVYRTTDTENMDHQGTWPLENGALTVDLPSKSVVVLVSI